MSHYPNDSSQALDELNTIWCSSSQWHGTHVFGLYMHQWAKFSHVRPTCTHLDSCRIKLDKLQEIRLTYIHLDSCCTVSAIYPARNIRSTAGLEGSRLLRMASKHEVRVDGNQEPRRCTRSCPPRVQWSWSDMHLLLDVVDYAVRVYRIYTALPNYLMLSQNHPCRSGTGLSSLWWVAWNTFFYFIINK
jgi:hypothetical protein